MPDDPLLPPELRGKVAPAWYTDGKSGQAGATQWAATLNPT